LCTRQRNHEFNADNQVTKTYHRIKTYKLVIPYTYKC